MEPSKYQIRELTVEDAGSYADLLRSHKPTWAHDVPIDDVDQRSYEILKTSDTRVFAAELPSRRLSMSIASREWEAMPVYTIIDFKSVETLPFRDFKECFQELVHTLVSTMEAAGLWEFWYLIEDKTTYSTRAEREGRNIMQYLVPKLSNYTIFNEARFAANELPTWRVYSSMLSNRPANVPTVLRRAIHNRKLSDV